MDFSQVIITSRSRQRLRNSEKIGTEKEMWQKVERKKRIKITITKKINHGKEI